MMTTKQKMKNIMMAVSAFFFLALPYGVLADENAKSMLKKVGEGAGYAEYTGDSVFDQVAGGIVKPFLGLLGVVFLILILYGGFIWMTSRDDEEQINKAKKIIQRSVIGIILVASSFMIWQFIATILLE